MLLKMPSEKWAQNHGPKAQWPYLEKKLCDWTENQRENGCSLSTILIRIKGSRWQQKNVWTILEMDHPGATDFLKEIILTMRTRYNYWLEIANDWEDKKILNLKFAKEEFKNHALKLLEIGNMDRVFISTCLYLVQ